MVMREQHFCSRECVIVCVYLCVRERGTIQRRRNAGVGIPPDIICSLSFVFVVLLLFVDFSY